MTRPPIYIGLTGYAGTGKDTVADLLTAHCGAARVAFADKLRAEVSEAYCIDPEMLTRRETKEHPMSALALYRCLDADFAKAVRAAGGVLWQIKRPGYGPGVGTPGHSSDTDGSAFAPDAVISNAYDIGHLQHQVLAAYAQLRCTPLPKRPLLSTQKSETV